VVIATDRLAVDDQERERSRTSDATIGVKR
jgi:hypothetical protein